MLDTGPAFHLFCGREPRNLVQGPQSHGSQATEPIERRTHHPCQAVCEAAGPVQAIRKSHTEQTGRSRSQNLILLQQRPEMYYFHSTRSSGQGHVTCLQTEWGSPHVDPDHDKARKGHPGTSCIHAHDNCCRPPARQTSKAETLMSDVCRARKC